MPRMTFDRKFFRDLRESAGLTLEALAKQIKVDPTTVRKWEKGLTEPGLVSAARAAEALGVGVADLILIHERKTAEAAV